MTNSQRETMRIAVGRVLTNALNYPSAISAHILGRDMTQLIDAVVDSAMSRQTVPMYAMLDIWIALGNGSDVVGFEQWYEDIGGYAEAWAYLCAEVRLLHSKITVLRTGLSA
jgi:hypothetical protein